MTRLEFLRKHVNLKISERWFTWGPGILIQVHDTTIEPHNLVFEHFISDFDLDNLLVDYETIIMTPINNWLEGLNAKKDI